ncbi:mercuric transporter MerT family protein [Desulfoluna butyratoxydans]|uniref:Mercuric transport protein MerT n=1 Tax=Desulfoluna butyratoxydans TaxID=231438 RepID=A0A4V6IL84_9BACT|nr:mercuric transporter MerT family protein [Desulfoluna butyratoxydans]VFQ43488.1 mercuric transport protein mert [Desulfoluna butyratoxydans]
MAAEKGKSSNVGRIGLGGALVTGFFASACCIGPLTMVFLGISSAGALVALEPYRPIFLTLTLFFLAVAGYRTYRTPRKADCHEGACQTSNVKRRKIIFWGAALFVLGILFFPQLMLLFMD